MSDPTEAGGDETRPARRWQHWIAGAPSAPASGRFLASCSPADGRIVAHIAEGEATDVDRAVSSADQARSRWSTLTPLERSRVLRAIGLVIREHVDELNDLECAETGKLDATFEVVRAADYFEMYAGFARALTGEVIDVGPGSHVYTRREPWGVIGIISPWNGPLHQAIREIAPAIAAGNTVVIKPPEEASTTTLRFGELAQQAGLPDGVINVVTGLGPVAGAALVSHPRVRKVAFTGSPATGRAIARMAADRLIPATLELGGKSPHIIFGDADLDAAVPVAVKSFTANTGQICTAGTRLLVQKSVHDEFVERATAIVGQLRPGENLAPLITRKQYETVQHYFRTAEEDGATLHTGGAVVTEGELSKGLYVQPTIYTGVSMDMRIAKEEIFGPVLSVIRFDDETEAIDIANDTEYGLAAGLWTSDLSRAHRVAAALEVGNVYINGWGTPMEVPFGGYKGSGYGRERGFEALKDFTQTKSVMIHGLV